MVLFIAVSAAFIQFVNGIFIFKKPEIINFSATWISGLTALLAECLVLWSISLYPKKLRKLVPVGSCLFDYLASTFLIEYYMGNFWFPLEAVVMSLPEFTSQNLEVAFVGFSSNYEYISVFLKQESTAIILDQLLSFSTLILAMHATRMINLSLLRQGLTPFLCDVKNNFQRFLKQTLYPYIPSIPYCITKLKGKRRDEDEYLGEDEDDQEGDREEHNSTIEFKEDYGRVDDEHLDLNEPLEEQDPEELPPQEYYIFRRR